MSDQDLRRHLVRLLTWHDAHVDFDAAVAGIPAGKYGVQPAGLPYSPWQLVEHLRITQQDILDFSVNADYREKNWPDDYWPGAPDPPTAAAWDESLRAFRADRDGLVRLASDPSIDLYARVPQGDGQTYLRELLLAADHAAYHVGQLVAVRRLLGIWPASG